MVLSRIVNFAHIRLRITAAYLIRTMALLRTNALAPAFYRYNNNFVIIGDKFDDLVSAGRAIYLYVCMCVFLKYLAGCVCVCVFLFLDTSHVLLCCNWIRFDATFFIHEDVFDIDFDSLYHSYPCCVLSCLSVDVGMVRVLVNVDVRVLGVSES